MGQEATVRMLYGTTDWFKTENEVGQGCLLSPVCLTYMLRTSSEMPSWEELEAGIKISRRNINNLRYADDTTLKAESEEELMSLLMRVKDDSEKVHLRLTIKKN